MRVTETEAEASNAADDPPRDEELNANGKSVRFAATSNADERFNDRLKQKLSEEDKPSSKLTHFATASNADGKFDDRRKRNAYEGSHSNQKLAGFADAPTTADDRFHDRLMRKVQGDNANSNSVGFSKTPETAADKFEDRLRRKVTQAGNAGGSVGFSAAPNKADERFNDRLKRKAHAHEGDDADGDSAGASTALVAADERFDGRLKHKMSGEGSKVTAASNQAFERFEDRLRRKVKSSNEAEGGESKHEGEGMGATGVVIAREESGANADDEDDRALSSNGCENRSGAESFVVDTEMNAASDLNEGGQSAAADGRESLGRQAGRGSGGSKDEGEGMGATGVVIARQDDGANASNRCENRCEAESFDVDAEMNAASDPDEGGQLAAADGRESSGRQAGRGSGTVGIPDDRRSSVGRMMSTLYAHVSAAGEYLVAATLVEDDGGAGGEVVMAERVGVFERRGKLFAIAFCFVLVVLAVALPVSLTRPVTMKIATDEPSMVPSMVPSMPPSHDPRPTLEIVQERGVLRCGFILSEFDDSMCRAAASVILGDPNSCEQTTVWPGLQELQERSLDVIIDLWHTVKAEVKEETTGSGFVFSVPYFYDETVYHGDQTFVECAQSRARHGVCSSLRICFFREFAGLAALRAHFPSSFYVAASFAKGPNPLIEMREMMRNGTCNVAAGPVSVLSSRIWRDFFGDDDATIMGDRPLAVGPCAVVTRKNDREFSDVMNWVLVALVYGDERGLGGDPSLCRNYPSFPRRAPDLNFMNGIHCVGNYSSMLATWSRKYSITAPPRNRVDNGTAGLLFATPLGPSGDGDADDTGAAAFLNDVADKGPLQCGVVVRDDFDGDVMMSDELVGMSADFCRALAAALFSGSSTYVNVTGFSNDDGLVALNNGAIDMLAGGKVEKKYDFASPSLGLEGFDFSTPYFYGNEPIGDGLSVFALATREDNAVFSSFVNCVVLATIYAQEKAITKEQSNFMSLMPWFGSDFEWALRDVVHYTGRYDELYEKHFGVIPKEERGRNRLNEGGPLLYSIPGLSHERGNDPEEN